MPMISMKFRRDSKLVREELDYIKSSGYFSRVSISSIKCSTEDGLPTIHMDVFYQKGYIPSVERLLTRGWVFLNTRESLKYVAETRRYDD